MDPASYRFTNVPLASIYAQPDGKKEVARVFLGEWMKLEPGGSVTNGYRYVRYRGGKGWIATKNIGTVRKLEVFFIDVGQGDSILIQTPDDRRVLIDGGPGSQALKFLENKYRLDKPDNFIDFEAVISTHSDADHVAGLIGVLSHPQIGVKRFYHNGLFPKAFRKKNGRAVGLLNEPRGPGLQKLMKELAAAIDTARSNLPKVIQQIQQERPHAGAQLPPAGFVCQRADSSLGYIPPFDAGSAISLKVLWPEADPVPSYPWYVDEGKTKNGNSVALLLTHGDNTILLAGDLNAASMTDIVAKRGPRALDAIVYKAAHHGSQDYTLGFLKAVRPNAAVIASGDDRNSVYGHPRAVLLGSITRYSKCSEPGVFSTELAACYSPLRGADLKKFNASIGQLYSRSIQGIIHLRSDGKRLCMGRVYGRSAPKDAAASTTWKWDVWPR